MTATTSALPATLFYMSNVDEICHRDSDTNVSKVLPIQNFSVLIGNLWPSVHIVASIRAQNHFEPV